MNQHKRQVMLRGRIPHKRDTPVGSTRRRRRRRGREGYKRFPTLRHHDTLQEMPEEEQNESTVKPVSLMEVIGSPPFFSSSRFSENQRSKPASSVTLAGKSSGHQNVSTETYPEIPVSLIPEVLKCNATPQSGMFCFTEEDSTLNFEEEEHGDEEEEEDDDYSSSSITTTLSSCPSPEIFRKEMIVDSMTFPCQDDLLGFHVDVKNSTLLEESYAENIHRHHPPNISTIIETSTILVENKCEINSNKKLQCQSKTDSCKSDQAFERKTPGKLSERKTLVCRKVCFKSPITTEIKKAEDITSSTASGKDASNTLSAKLKINQTTSKTSLISFNNETLPLAVTLKRPAKTNPQNARFLQFVNDAETDAYFQKIRERRVKLEIAAFMPFKSGVQS